ncbi:hypothetical protein G6F56_007080 [Rhizopus delemar]|uniref:cAMP-dependent protein kinase n=1 Tax=Rhizopus stolonifer TaxID=4846 RepID=A0A367J1L0_RHIST|nr:hypothetical protein G6F56_007080 [Rhizopus delemar]RCH83838.1 camp-dependent protein kinase catalytic subunit [Rhizopus stolonifer]
MRENINPFFNRPTPPAWNPTFYLCDHNDTSSLITKIENATESTHTPSEEHPALDLTPSSSISINGCIPVPRILTPNEDLRVPAHFQLNQFNIKQRIGSGHSSQVYLAQHVMNHQLYAIKAIDKQLIVTETQMRHIYDEKQVLMTVHHPFLMRLWGTFQTGQYLHLVTEYLPGGELSRLMKKKFSEDQARFYAAEIVSALEHLHQRDIVYRDLKPENVVLDSRGHVKLIDFGFAKVLKEVTFTLCGTPDYLAPEIIRARGYTQDVDWWSLGVFIFEMLVGVTPFFAETPMELYQNILLCDINWMCDMSTEAKDLIQGLLQSKPKDRFKIDDIKAHPWFSAIDFDQLSNMTAPFIPEQVNHSNNQVFTQFYDISEHQDDRFNTF